MTQAEKKASFIMKRFLPRGARYLWTDAYALANLVWLGQEEQAVRLIDEVHGTLGRHRHDDRRSGWLSSLSPEEGELHPTIGGLRIGKPLPERTELEAFDQQMEWERDGQYFHYITRWAQALVLASSLDRTYRAWARELLDTATRRFLHSTPSGYRMYWKMSLDLSRPLVPSMGHHDPLDGLVTGLCVGEVEVQPYRSIVEGQDLVSTDPLGIGGLLSAAARLKELQVEEELYRRVVDSALIGLKHYRWGLGPEADARGRLGFRELGLAIGIRGCDDPELESYREKAEELIHFWSRDSSRSAASWQAHLDINEVMLANALLCRPGRIL